MVKKLTIEEVQHVARLASLPLTKEDYRKYFPQLSEIIDFVSKLQTVDTKSVLTTSQVTGLENVFREDEIDTTRMLTQDQALSNAKDSYNGFFKVPSIF